MAKLLNQAPAHGFAVSIWETLEFDIKAEVLSLPDFWPPSREQKQFRGTAQTKLPAGGKWPLGVELQAVTGVSLDEVFNDTVNFKYQFGSHNLEFVKFYNNNGKLLGEIINAVNDVFPDDQFANHEHGEGIGSWK